MKLGKTGLLVALITVIGCGIAEGPREKLNRGSFAFNEGLRWGRYNDVLPVVDQAAMEHFMAMHQGWGDTIKVSSAEITQTTYDEKTKKAVVTVKFTWYRSNQMELFTTLTNQNWTYRSGKWWMEAESYVSGTPF